MNVLRTAVTAIAISLAGVTASYAHDEDDLGVVRFPTSCSPQVQADFERGVAMLHSYWFSYAGKTFKSVLEKDPNCAMAYWGIALDLMGNTLGNGPPVKDVQAGLEAIEKGIALGAKTQRERDWIAAAGQYFRGYNDVPLETRLLAYTSAMDQITQRYPDDYEAWIFYALTLQASAPKSDLTYANQIKSAAILDKMYQQNPKHPGVSHFLIHAFDYPPLAEKGIPAARRYAGIAPAVPHARHMPSHIYSMVGLWEESIASNARALEIQPDYRHASDFTVYAHLQLAQDAQAKAVMEKSISIPDRGDPGATLLRSPQCPRVICSNARTGKVRHRCRSRRPHIRWRMRSRASRAGLAWRAAASSPAQKLKSMRSPCTGARSKNPAKSTGPTAPESRCSRLQRGSTT